jgi:hypothetical protein
MTVILHDEWLADFERVCRLPRPDGEGVTVDELSRATGLCAASIRRQLHLVRDRLIVSRRVSTRLDGQPCLTPTYRLKPEG